MKEKNYKQELLEAILDNELNQYGLRVDKIKESEDKQELLVFVETVENSVELDGVIRLANSLEINNKIRNKVINFIADYFDYLK